MDFVCLLVEVFKIKNHSVAAIFLPPYEYIGNNFLVTMPGGLNHMFSQESLDLEIDNGRFSDGPCASGKKFLAGCGIKINFHPHNSTNNFII